MRHHIAVLVTTGSDAAGSAKKPRSTVLTVGVDDRERSLRFSRAGPDLVSEASVRQELD
jgi:hypothetical protein